MAKKDPFAVEPIQGARGPSASTPSAPGGLATGSATRAAGGDQTSLSDDALSGDEDDTNPMASALAANYHVQQVTFTPTVEKDKVVEPNQPLGKVETLLGPGKPPEALQHSGQRGETSAAGTVDDGRNLNLGIPRNGNQVTLPNRSVMREQLASGPVGGDRSSLMSVLQQGQAEPGKLDLVG